MSMYLGSTKISGDSQVYSTTERRIGTWIDGKPYYLKVYVVHGMTVYPYDLNVKDLHMEHVDYSESTHRNYSGVSSSPNTKYEFSPYYANDSDKFDLFHRMEGDQDIMRIRVGELHRNANTDTFVVLKYTKTTDKAGD